jgi:hypothetical protein
VNGAIILEWMYEGYKSVGSIKGLMTYCQLVKDRVPRSYLFALLLYLNTIENVAVLQIVVYQVLPITVPARDKACGFELH